MNFKRMINGSLWPVRSKSGLLLLPTLVLLASGAERIQRFDRDPLWDGRHNRSAGGEPRMVKQDFGFSDTARAGGTRGETGGFITPTAEPAYYGKRIAPKTFQDRLSAAGKLNCQGRQFNALIGFFNADTVNEWRTPNTLALRIYGRGDVFYAYIEYATSKWRAGAIEFGSREGEKWKMKEFASGDAVHRWWFEYDPDGNAGGGSIKVNFSGQEFAANLDPGHKADGAAFNRFGLLNVVKSHDGGGEVWLDDVTINGQAENFTRDPGWEGFHNRLTHPTREVRPWFDFGYSPTHFAGGAASGELGGVMFRGDGRKPEFMAFYGDRLDPLTLDAPLKASGKVALRRAVSDSDTLIGFFHSEHSLNSGNTDRISTPPDFFGIRIGGPSREGFLFAPIYRLHNGEDNARSAGPYIYPDGKSHDWTFEYLPDAANGRGGVTVTLDGQSVSVELPAGHKGMGARFNRFGLITTHIDGNGQRIYFDDLSYTSSQKDSDN